MKKGKYLFIIIFMLVLLMPIRVAATNTTNKIALVGNSSVGPGNTVTYDIRVATTETAQKLTTELTYDTTVLELVSIVNKQWQGDNKIGNSPINLEFTTNGANGLSEVATLTFKVKQETTKTNTALQLKYTTITVVSTNAESSIPSIEDYKKDINIYNTDATLSSLKINDSDVNGFRSKTYNYNMIVDSTTQVATIQATPSAKSSTFVDNFGPRDIELNYGINKVEIKVKAESGDIKTYTINITREDTRATNNYLKDIIINGGKVPIDFNKMVLDYTLKTYKLDTLDIEATPEDSTSTVNVVKPNNLIVGENTVKISVKSQSGKEQIYTLVIINSDTQIDTKLKNLSVKDHQINFDPNKLDYEIVFDKSMEDGLKIYATTNTKDAQIEITDNDNLKVGSKIKIIVSAEDGSQTIYTITITKDNRINFFMLLELVIIVVLIVLIIIQIIKRNKRNKPKTSDKTKNKNEAIEESATIEMNTAEFKIN